MKKMKDYKELIRQLRECGDNCDDCPHYPNENCMFALMEEAADAIEELTKESLSDDGTLFVETDYDMAKIGRVHVLKRGTHDGGIFYDDEPPKSWISVKDKLPKDKEIVVGARNYDGKWEAGKVQYYAKDKRFSWFGIIDYWMPFPEPPKEE